MPHAKIIPVKSESASFSTNATLDRLHRPMRDLRISVTDRCNLRCTYCMPGEIFDKSHIYLPRTELLSLEEIVRVANLFVNLGVLKIRLTGGEPLLRRGIENLIEALSVLRTPQGEPVEIAMTTNGVLLADKAQRLKEAGLSRITVSLDGLDEAIFQRMSGSNTSVGQVLAGIRAALQAGLAPVKVNMVVKRGVNDCEILPMSEYFRNTGVILRFIEYMDAGSSNGWLMNEVFPAEQIVKLISARHPLIPVDPNFTGEVASRYTYADAGGEIGLIASVTRVFCDKCTRMRLSTDGKLYTCLFADQAGADLKNLLRQGGDEELSRAIAGCWQNRQDRYSEIRHEVSGAPRNKIEMSYIGG
ncbi:MAG: GTP 3',8-cyclase MoaA [Gallionella sp.]|jgi:cyclic pyranopterin phosphate synthase